MMHLDKVQLSAAILDNRQQLDLSVEPPVDQHELVAQASERYGFTVDADKLRTVPLTHWSPKPPYDGAVLFVRGPFAITPTFDVVNEMGRHVQVQPLIFSLNVVDRANRDLSNELIKADVVTLFEGLDAEYLYEVLSETVETMMFELVQKVAPGIPVFNITFKENGEFKVEEADALDKKKGDYVDKT